MHSASRTLGVSLLVSTTLLAACSDNDDSSPGIAQLSLQAAQQHDVPVIQGTLLVTVAVVLLANIAINAGLLALNPAARRDRSQRAGAQDATPGLSTDAAPGPATNAIPGSVPGGAA